MTKQKSRYTDIKNQRELCSRFKMMFYVTTLKFKDGTVIAPKHLLTVPKRIEWWVTVFSLSIPPALGGFATSQSYIYSVVVLIRGILLYTIELMFVNGFGDGFEYLSLEIILKYFLFPRNNVIILKPN